MSKNTKWEPSSGTKITISQMTQEEIEPLLGNTPGVNGRLIPAAHVGYFDAWGISNKFTLGDKVIKSEFEAIPGVDRCGVTNGGFNIQCRKDWDAFDATEKILEHMHDKKYITHDQLVEIYKELGLTQNPKTPSNKPELTPSSIGRS